MGFRNGMMTSKLMRVILLGLKPNPLLIEPGHAHRQEIGFQVAVGRRQRADAVERNDDRLRILEIEEDVLLEQRLLVFLVLLGSGDRSFAG